jgi:hypothetical protein
VQNHTKNLGAFKTQYHNAGLEGSLDPVLERVRLLRDPARYPVRREITDEGEQWGVPSAQITQRQADRLMGHVRARKLVGALKRFYPFRGWAFPHRLGPSVPSSACSC